MAHDTFHVSGAHPLRNVHGMPVRILPGHVRTFPFAYVPVIYSGTSDTERYTFRRQAGGIGILRVDPSMLTRSIVLQRSEDGAKTWQTLRTIDPMERDTVADLLFTLRGQASEVSPNTRYRLRSIDIDGFASDYVPSSFPDHLPENLS